MPIKKYLLTGLLAWLPLTLTIWVLLWLVGLLDSIFGSFLTGLAALTPDSTGEVISQLRAALGPKFPIIGTWKMNFAASKISVIWM